MATCARLVAFIALVVARRRRGRAKRDRAAGETTTERLTQADIHVANGLGHDQ